MTMNMLVKINRIIIDSTKETPDLFLIDALVFFLFLSLNMIIRTLFYINNINIDLNNFEQKKQGQSLP